MRPNPVKVQALARLKASTSTKDLQSFLGMVTHIAPFIPHLNEHTAQLRKLLQKDVDFQWRPDYEEAFMTVIQLICQAVSLACIDPSKTTVIQVDASQEALGAALTEEGKPITFASESFTVTEELCTNIEREVLTCVGSDPNDSIHMSVARTLQ